jgi:hypothetical protein
MTLNDASPGTLRRRPLVIGAAVLLAAGCAGSPGIEAVSVLTHDQCQGLNPGLTQVDFAAVAGIRGSTLLGMTANAPAADDAATDDAATDDAAAGAAAAGAAAGELLLVAISRGTQPTPGYGLTLQGAHREAGTAVIEVRWQTPESGALLPQVITHPCLVVGLADAAVIDRVEAVDQRGESLGSVTVRR